MPRATPLLLLANGQGKARASRNGTARQCAAWRLLFLAAGEESLSALMARAGLRPTAGQEIRLAEIDAGAMVAQREADSVLLHTTRMKTDFRSFGGVNGAATN